LLDLVTVKLLIHFSSRPAHWFGLTSLPFVVLSIMFGVGAIGAYLQSYTEESAIILPSLFFLMLMLSFHLLLLGVLGELIVDGRKSNIPETFRHEIT